MLKRGWAQNLNILPFVIMIEDFPSQDVLLVFAFREWDPHCEVNVRRVLAADQVVETSELLSSGHLFDGWSATNKVFPDGLAFAILVQ